VSRRSQEAEDAEWQAIHKKVAEEDHPNFVVDEEAVATLIRISMRKSYDDDECCAWCDCPTPDSTSSCCGWRVMLRDVMASEDMRILSTIVVVLNIIVGARTCHDAVAIIV
jgi:hypothetical protein